VVKPLTRPVRNSGPAGRAPQHAAPGGPRRYIPPNRRNAAPGAAPWNSAPMRAPQNPAPMRAPQNPLPGGAPRNPGARWNPAPGEAPRNAAPGVPPRHVGPTTSVPLAALPTVNEAPRPMSRNTSYPVNEKSESRSSSSNLRGGRGAQMRPTQASRSNSRTRGAPAHDSRSKSREPQNTPSRPPRASQPPVGHSTIHPVSISTPANGVAISFDTKHIIYDYMVSKLKMAGVKKPTQILVDDGRVRVFFASASVADDASRSRILYDNGAAMTISTIPANGIAISFDTKHIAYDYNVSKLKMAGVKKPTKILVDDGRVRVFFASASDAENASRSRMLYDNGAPMEIYLMGTTDETKV